MDMNCTSPLIHGYFSIAKPSLNDTIISCIVQESVIITFSIGLESCIPNWNIWELIVKCKQEEIKRAFWQKEISGRTDRAMKDRSVYSGVRVHRKAVGEASLNCWATSSRKGRTNEKAHRYMIFAGSTVLMRQEIMAEHLSLPRSHIHCLSLHTHA